MTAEDFAKIFGVAKAHGWSLQKTVDYLAVKYGRRSQQLTAREVDDVCEHIHQSSPHQGAHSEESDPKM